MLKEEFKIMCIHQVTRSPFTNVLDLGVWTTLQLEVERRHFMKRYSIDALVNVVMSTWNDGHLDDSIGKVFNHLERVLILINEGGGGNDLVKSKRGKANKDIKFNYELNVSLIQKANMHMVDVEDEDHNDVPVDLTNETRE